MKKAFTLLVFSCIVVSSLVAQIPRYSPIPVEVRIETQDGLIRVLDYGKPAEWCDTLIQTVIGDVTWAYGIDSLGNQTDSLVCDSMASDLTGKIALISRGDCEFGLKALRAQEAGAIGVIIVNRLLLGEVDGTAVGGPIGMGGGANGAQVHIPTVSLSKEDGIIIGEKLNAGIPVTAFFEVRSFSSPRTAYCYQTPLPAVKPLEDISAVYINIDPLITIPSVTVNAEITNPAGATTTISQTIANVAPLSVIKVDFDDTYTPNAVGNYNVKFTNSLTPDELESDFIISDYTYAIDNGDIVPNTNGTLEPNDTTFTNVYGGNFFVGNVYRTGAAAVTATHASFMISNPDELYTGQDAGDKFTIRIYNADPDGNGSVPYPAAFPSYLGLNESGGPLIPIATTEYILKDTDQGFQFFTAEFPSPVTLAPNKIYLLMVEYNGLEAGVGIPPKYAFGGTERFAGEVGSMVFVDSLLTDGFGVNYIVRLHLQGFISGTDNPLEDQKISLSPNPASKSVNLEFDLNQVATEVEVLTFDFTGRLVGSRSLENVQKGRYPFDVSKLPNGTYFMSVNTPEGFRSKKFVVMH